MTIFSVVAIFIGVLAGLINVGIGILRREVIIVSLMRFAAALVSFAAPVTIFIIKAEGGRIVPTAWHQTVYLVLALAIFVGITLMVPASIERNITPPAPETTPKRTTGKLTGDAGVRIANQNEEWVN